MPDPARAPARDTSALVARRRAFDTAPRGQDESLRNVEAVTRELAMFGLPYTPENHAMWLANHPDAASAYGPNAAHEADDEAAGIPVRGINLADPQTGDDYVAKIINATQALDRAPRKRKVESVGR